MTNNRGTIKRTTDKGFGFIATADGGAALNPSAGQITTALAPRQVQFAAKLVF